MTYRIPFNRPFVVGRELFHIAQAVTNGQLAADGPFTRKCVDFLQRSYGIGKVLMTPSCTSALEMSYHLLQLSPGDEVIMPSYTFVSTANALVLAGGTPRFADVRADTLNLDERALEPLINERTRAICVVHYAGVGAEMDAILELAEKHHLTVIEDAAQGVHARYKGKHLGSFGQLATFSFHETKNFICGEGGALCINQKRYEERAEIIRDKGTNRQQFLRGDAQKYTWVDIGASHVPSELNCAFLWGQLEYADQISIRRAALYERYKQGLADLERKERLRLPHIPEHCSSNHHLFHIVLPSAALRDKLMDGLKTDGILSVFHYVPLHTSPMGQKLGYAPGDLPITESVSERLLRLPLYYDLSEEDQAFVIERIHTHLEA
jgi:dTDP-4-amino-4,6-dideoxygalactose transaminase